MRKNLEMDDNDGDESFGKSMSLNVNDEGVEIVGESSGVGYDDDDDDSAEFGIVLNGAEHFGNTPDVLVDVMMVGIVVSPVESLPRCWALTGMKVQQRI